MGTVEWAASVHSLLVGKCDTTISFTYSGITVLIRWSDQEREFHYPSPEGDPPQVSTDPEKVVSDVTEAITNG